MENFVLNGNGQIDINRKGMESTYKFHLQEINHNTEVCSSKDVCDDTATSISSYSNYKQRIDAMFDDSRSILSDMSRRERKRKSLMSHRDSQREICKERVISNNIQEKIEKMFEEISVNGLQRNNSEIHRLSQRDRRSSFSSTENNLKHDFKVNYLGSKPLRDKNVSLLNLQDPLKELYFEFKKKPPEGEVHVLTISREGLKINISGKEELNQFSTIAVWASVKLSFRETQSKTEYAFLPLVTEPDGIDKNLLYKELKSEDKFITRSTAQGKGNIEEQSPIFTVVMKNFKKNKQLECHGFVCKSSEEAIVIAANLYQALMKKLKRKKDFREQKVKKADKEVVIEVLEPVEESNAKPKVKVKKPAPPVPDQKQQTKLEEKVTTPPPSPEISNLLNGSSPDEERIPKVEKLEEKRNSPVKLSQRRGSVPINIHNNACEPPRTLRRTVSERGSNGILLKDSPPGEGGDILTKVAIPRSRSFLNANGPLTRYSGRHKTNAKNEILSPLGFKELFNEFRLHEGLESMDDILNAIIDAEGMSFNDLKPIYKEFLLKLAVTLTKDELYQRSKIIMRRQKKRNKKCNFRKRAFLSSIGFHKFFRKTAKKLGKSKTSKPTNLEFTSVVFQSTSKQFESNLPNLSKNQKSCRIKKRPSSRRRLAKRIERVKNKHISTTSEDSDFFQPKRNTNDSGGGPNRASSGYFSCSECSCDSENCICIRTDKCYCTLGNNKSYNASSSDESRIVSNSRSSFRIAPQQTDQEDSLRSCSCDTDSCVDSAKCYCTQNKNKRSANKIYHLSEVRGICQTPHLHQKEKLHNTDCPVYIKNGCRKHGDSIFDQLKQQGFAASESTLSRAASPSTAWLTNEINLKQKKCLKSTGSLEYLHVQRPDSQYFPNFDDQYLREIQNLTQKRDLRRSSFVERGLSLRKQNLPVAPSFLCGRRQYSSMRCRNESVNDYNPEILGSVSGRTKNFFNSVRSRHSCDSIMNHIKFPNANDVNNSLRFTRRMDVYNSFSESRRYKQHEDFVTYKENSRKGLIEHEVLSEDSDRFQFSNGNLKRLDYNLFKNSKPALDPRMNKKKVLVVSARDPKGKVLYMGTSNRSDTPTKNKKNIIDGPTANASEALAVKKSAEIAALFSDVTLKQKINHPDYAKDQKQNNQRQRSNSYRTTNLENTLGYLP